MSTQTTSTARPRKSICISDQDLNDLETIRNAPEAAGLEADTRSESAVLARALHEGIRLMRETLEGSLYAAEAAARAGDPAAQAEREGRRAHRNRNAARREALEA